MGTGTLTGRSEPEERHSSRSPYPDVVAYLTSIWMLTPFSAATGGTLIIPRSHTWRIDPLGNNGPAADASDTPTRST